MNREEVVQKLLIAVEFEEDICLEFGELAKHIDKFKPALGDFKIATTMFIEDVTLLPTHGLSGQMEGLRVNLNKIHNKIGVQKQE
jgi:hypothetical protein